MVGGKYCENQDKTGIVHIYSGTLHSGRDHSAQASVSISDMKTAQARHLDMEVTLASPERIYVKITNKGDGTAGYSKVFTLYKYEKGKWEKVRGYAESILKESCLRENIRLSG